MTELIKSFDSYNDFERTSYFTICFNALASNLIFESPLKETRENMEAVLETINLESMELQVIFKNWNTEDAKNADSKKDFPYQYLLKSVHKSLIIWVSLDTNEITVDVLYDVSDKNLEAWILNLHQKLKVKFGERKTAVFKVLSRNGNRFYTEDVNTDDFSIDVEKSYNEDFMEVDKIITDAMAVDRSGIILLHGTPGTGKTTYIKSLITKFKKNSFIFIQNEFVNELLHPDFISFLLNHKNSILIIEDAEKVITTREYSNENSVVSTILQLTDGLFSDYLNIKIICTFNTSIDKIDKALLRKGRMIAYYDFKPLSSVKSDILLNSMGYEANGEEMTLADIYNFKEKGFEQSQNNKKIGFLN